jgi:hypothetical protein
MLTSPGLGQTIEDELPARRTVLKTASASRSLIGRTPFATISSAMIEEAGVSNCRHQDREALSIVARFSPAA